MATKLTGLVLLALFVHSSAYGDCDDPFHIKKQTWSTSDSRRDIASAYAIFPDLHDQNVLQFIEGECAYSLKLELPDTCFQLHAPQTYGRDPGLLHIETYEQTITQKWHNVMSPSLEPITPYNYDAFFDFNFAFWVQSLDEYIAQWIFNDDNQDLDGEYFGIKWKYTLNTDLEITSPFYENNAFYSILMHSPSSSIIYEFISYKKPSNDLYSSMKWIESSVHRATFMSMNPFPWNRDDKAVIVPLRISRATTDINAMYDWYYNVMESQVLDYSFDGVMDDMNGDNVLTKYAFFSVLDTQIEVQLIERPSYYTFGSFGLLQYEALLLEGHDSIISTPYCGIDRWFDNHYGLTTWGVPGYLDRILYRLRQRGLKYRIYRETKEHTTPTAKQHLEEFGLDELYIFFIFEPSGQTVQLMGFFTNTWLPNVPLWNQQWCETTCPYGSIQGSVNPQHVYIDYEDGNNVLSINADIYDQYHIAMSVSATVFMVLCIIACLAYYVCKRIQRKPSHNDDGNNHDYIYTPLIQK